MGMSKRAWLRKADESGAGWPFCEIEDLGEALHEIVGELQAAVIAARAEERRVFSPVVGEHEGAIEPFERSFGKGVSAVEEEIFFRFFFGLLFQAERNQRGAGGEESSR